MTVEEFIAEWGSEKNYIIAHTSGSTGVPKPIRLPKDLVEASARRTIEFFALSEKSRLHLTLSPDYIAGKMMIVRALLAGCSLTYEEPSNRPLSGISSSDHISLLAVVPSQLPSILGRNADSLPQIDNMIVGGSAVTEEISRRLAEREFCAYETYGMTETASHVALRRLDGSPTTPFVALPGISFNTSADNALIINLPDMEPLLTKDCVELIDNQSFRLVGRLDNVIISGAVKVHPEIVEAKIVGLLKGRAYYIVGKKNEKWGEVPVLKIEGPRLTDSKIRILSDAMRDMLPPAERPAEIVFIDQFNRTSSGKIIRG